MSATQSENHPSGQANSTAEMKRMSSRTTFLNKRVLPVVWFGFLAFMVAVMLTAGFSGVPRQGPLLPALVGPLSMGVFGFFLFRKLVWDLADEVFDCGDHLLVKRSGQQERIALSNIMNVGWSTFSNPARITLTLRESTAFGREIAFTPPVRFNPFSRSPLIDDLIERVDRQRSR